MLTLTSSVPQYIGGRTDIDQNIRKGFAGYDPNPIEKMGERMLYPITGIPKFFGYLKSPAAQVVAITTVLIVAVFFLFYPNLMQDLIERGFKFVANTILTNPEYAKIGGVVISIYTTVGWGMRAYGRFTNEKMQKAFAIELKEKPASEPAEA